MNNDINHISLRHGCMHVVELEEKPLHTNLKCAKLE